MFEKEAIKERSEFNKELYEKIFRITGKPEKILDLGCGLNPLNFPYKDVYYMAIDVNKEVLKKVKKHFRKNKITGEVIFSDINDISKLERLKKVDIALIFKVFDGFDKKNIKKIMKKIKTRYFVISFATRTITGKRMRNPKRGWFEKMFKIDGKIRFYNEVFYIMRK